jgi:hypothetical protein
MPILVMTLLPTVNFTMDKLVPPRGFRVFSPCSAVQTMFGDGTSAFCFELSNWYRGIADQATRSKKPKRLAASVKGPKYIDSRGSVYEVDGVREEVDKAIERVAKLNESAQHEK